MDLNGKRILVVGLAREGVSLCRFLADRGAIVTVTDAAPSRGLQDRIATVHDIAEAVVGADHPELVQKMDLVFVSPGVPETNAVYTAALAAEVPIRSMTTLFFDLCPGMIVGITGSSGKTTTTGLIGHFARTADLDSAVAGNIGDPMLDLLPRLSSSSIVILELSSFQLQLLRRGPHIAVVTNITPNHLDRHGSMQAYVAAKRNIVEHQSPDDYAVLNACDPEVVRWQSLTPASAYWFNGPRDAHSAVVQNNQVGVRHGDSFTAVLPAKEVPLVGTHNLQNVLAAVAVGDILGISPAKMADAIRSFVPAPHRLQLVKVRAGVRYIDDSIATSPARAVVALDAISSPVVLIAGGRDKHLPWDDFARVAIKKARSLLLLGEAADLVREAVLRHIGDSDGLLSPSAIRRFDSLPDAVLEASRLAQPGDAVLLSPGCTSYDMFANFEERGAVFARAVESLDAA